MNCRGKNLKKKYLGCSFSPTRLLSIHCLTSQRLSQHFPLTEIKKEELNSALSDQSKSRRLPCIYYPAFSTHHESNLEFGDHILLYKKIWTQFSRRGYRRYRRKDRKDAGEQQEVKGSQRLLLRELSPGQQQQKQPTSLTPLSLYAIDSTFTQHKHAP